MMNLDAPASMPSFDASAAGPADAVGFAESTGDASSYDLFTPVGSTVSYNIPDGQEQNPEIVRSEMMFYSTPVTEKYAEAAYGAIKNIQGMCAADYQSLCPTSSPYMNLNYMMSELMTPMLFSGDNVYRRRRLHLAAPEKRAFRSGAEYVAHLRSFYSTRFLPSVQHPLAHVMYRDEKTNQFVNPTKEKEKGLRGSSSGIGEKLTISGSSKPRSYLTGIHHNHMQLGDTHRRLRMASPDFVYPTAAEGSAESADQQAPDVPRKPCASARNAASSPEVAGSVADVGMDFRKFVLDFLNGRDVSVSLVGRDGFSGSADVRAPLGFLAADDDAAADDGYYYYSYDDADGAGDDAYYYYDDAAAADDGDDDADDDAADDDEEDDDADDDGAVDDSTPTRTMALMQTPPGLSNMFGMLAPRLSQMSRPPMPRLMPAPLQRAPRGEHDHHDHRDDHDHYDRDHDHHGRDGSTEGSGEASGESDASEEHDSNGRSSSSEGSSEEGGWFGGGDHRGPPPPPPAPEDRSFNGGLGFGAEGDMCLYDGMSQGRVSDPCVDAVADLYELRAEYWQESQQPQGHHHGFAVLLVLGLLVGCLARHVFRFRHEKKVRSLLTALHTHPALKAAVEAETGVTVPEPVPQSCCARRQGGAGCTQSGLMRFAKVTALFVGLLVLTFWLSFTALEITMHVVHNLDEHAPADPTGEPQYTSPVAAMAILLLVISAEVTAVALVFRGLKACCCPAAAPAADGTPAAPRQCLIRRVADYAHRLAGFGGSQSGPDGYSRLPAGEEAVYETSVPAPRTRFSAPAAVATGTEMVTMSSMHATAPPMQQQVHAYAPQQQLQQQRYAAVLVPVTAMPVNSVSMV